MLSVQEYCCNFFLPGLPVAPFCFHLGICRHVQDPFHTCFGHETGARGGMEHAIRPLATWHVMCPLVLVTWEVQNMTR